MAAGPRDVAPQRTGVMGYTLLVFVVLTPVAFLVVTLLGMTRRYPL